METRKLKEKEFHDKIRTVINDTGVAETRWSAELEATISDNPLWVNMKYYAIERKSRDLVLGWFRKNCVGKRVLDLCCGNGEDGIYIAKNGASEVVGVDISDISIANCRKSSQINNVDHIISHSISDAENTGFDNNSFDVVTEYGALHHLDLDKAFAEIARVLKPDGKVICNESLAHNIFIHLYRKMTPQLRTEWEVEHIMCKKDFQVAEKYFNKIELHFFHLFTLFAVPFRKLPFFGVLLTVFEKIDDWLLRLPFVKWQAWQVVFILSEPKMKLVKTQEGE